MREESVKKALRLVGAVFALAFFLAPFVWMALVSLSSSPYFLSTGSSFSPTLRNYVDVLSSGSLHLLRYLLNSIVVSAVTAVCATCLAGLAAYAITRMKFRGKIVIPILMLALSMFPQISIAGYVFRLMTSLGWINTYYALVFPYVALALPLALWIMLSYLSQLPVDLDEAALVDGATRMQILRMIILPISLPGAVSACLLVFIYAFNEFLFAFMLTVDFRARTIPVGIALFEGLHGRIPWGSVMAASVIAIAPVIVLASFFQRRIIQGLSQGALKG
jgi:trehalose/maltose transport system permease protein